MTIKQVPIYTIDEHPAPEACFDWIRNNWHDLNEHTVDEVIDSLRAAQSVLGGSLDYIVSQVPDRGEFITFAGFDKDALAVLDADELPLTGVCYDYDVIEGLRNDDLESRLLNMIHNETKWRYSDEALKEDCEANEYYFFEDGSIA